MSRHEPTAANATSGRRPRRRPRVRPAFAFAPAALALLTALVFAPASLGSWTPLHGLASGPPAVDAPSVAAAETRAESARITEAVPPTDRADGQSVDCAAPNEQGAVPADRCRASGATDDHADPLDVPDWQDPGIPVDTPSPVPSPEQSPLSGFVWPVGGVITSLFGAAHPL